MAAHTATAIPPKPFEQDLVIIRTFDAPREHIWQAWTDPEQLARWWGPQYFTAPFARIDLRVGGGYLFCMRSPEDMDYWSTGIYREIDPPRRLVFTDNFADAAGNVVSAEQYGMGGDWPDELLVTLTLEEADGKTVQTLRHTGIPAGEMREMCTAGWNGSFDKLAASLKDS